MVDKRRVLGLVAISLTFDSMLLGMLANGYKGLQWDRGHMGLWKFCLEGPYDTICRDIGQK